MRTSALFACSLFLLLASCSRSKKEKCEAMKKEMEGAPSSSATDDGSEAFMDRCLKLDEASLDCVATSIHQHADGGRGGKLSPECEEQIRNLRVEPR